MKNTCIFLIILILSLGATAAQIPQGQQIVEDLKDRVSFGKGLILSKLSGEERRIAETIRVRVVESDDPGRVRATKEEGSRVIEVSTGFARVIVRIVDAMQHLPPKEAIGYINYIVSSQKENYRRYVRGAAMQPVKDPYEWANIGEETRNQIFNSPNRVVDDRLVTGVVAFVLAHEYGHHLKRHVDRVVDSRELSRELEAEADAWAIEAMLRADVGPMVGIYAFLYYAELDCDAIRHETLRTHPADITRLRQVVAETLKGLPRLSVQGDRKSVERGLTELLTTLESQISEGIACLSAMSSSAQAPSERYEDLPILTFQNNPEAARLIEYGRASSKIHWHTNGNPPLVEFNLTYINSSDASLTGLVTVLSGHLPRSGGDADGKWEEKYRKHFPFSLKGGGKATITGVMPWYREADTMPALRYPKPPQTDPELLRANFLPGPRPTTKADGWKVQQANDPFARALLMVTEAARLNFEPIRGEKLDSDESSEDFVCKVMMPGAIEGRVSRDREDHSSAAFFTFLRTDDGSAAEGKYNELHRQIASALGPEWDSGDATPARRAATKRVIKFASQEATVRLTWHQYRSGGNSIGISVFPR